MKTLITGERGDIGSVICKFYQDNGLEIQAFDESTGVRGDRILHLAAKSPPATGDEICRSNILYLKKIVEYAEKNCIKEVVFFSGMSVYGEQNKEDVEEDDCIRAPDLYGVSKLFGEEFLRKSHLNVLCLRLPGILGYRNDTNFLSRCYIKLNKNECVELTNSEKLFNNFISIKNIFEFLVKLKIKKKFDVINLASEKEMSLIEIVELMKRQLKSEARIVVSHEEKKFFNISTRKARKEYEFTLHGAEESITSWLKERQGYEKKFNKLSLSKKPYDLSEKSRLEVHIER